MNWTSLKSNSNKIKHGIDFGTAKNIFLNENRIEIVATFPAENRFINIGKLDGKLWTVIFTIRGNSIIIISARRSREKEVKLYEEKYYS